MTRYLLAAAAVAAISTAAFAGDSKPVPMTDEQMDNVTAGRAVTQIGVGINTAHDPSSGNADNGFISTHTTTNPPGGRPGLGRCTAGPTHALCD